MDSKQAEDAVKALDYPSYSKFGVKRKKEWVTAQGDYRDAVQSIEEQWKSWLVEEYAFDLPEVVQEEIMTMAWSDGHHAGYQNVEGYFEKYADFANLVARHQDYSNSPMG